MAVAAQPLHNRQGLAVLIAACERLALLKEQKQAFEEKLRAINEEIEELSYRQIPELMRLHGMTQWKREDGVLFYLSTYCRARIKDGREEEFKAWLRESGFGELIKESVHPKSLNAWYRELAENEDVPKDVYDYLDVFEGVCAIMRRAK